MLSFGTDGDKPVFGNSHRSEGKYSHYDGTYLLLHVENVRYKNETKINKD